MIIVSIPWCWLRFSLHNFNRMKPKSISRRSMHVGKKIFIHNACWIEICAIIQFHILKLFVVVVRLKTSEKRREKKTKIVNNSRWTWVVTLNVAKSNLRKENFCSSFGQSTNLIFCRFEQQKKGNEIRKKRDNVTGEELDLEELWRHVWNLSISLQYIINLFLLPIPIQLARIKHNWKRLQTSTHTVDPTRSLIILCVASLFTNSNDVFFLQLIFGIRPYAEENTWRRKTATAIWK